MNNELADAGARIFYESAGCRQCHTIGGGRMAGPDLLGVVERRQLDWLRKFIQNAPAVIMSGDPIAQAIYEEYHGTIMPNMHLPDEAVDRVIHYLAAESQRVREKRGGMASAPSD